MEIQRQRNFSEIINDTFTFIKENFKELFKYYLMILGPFLVAEAIISQFVSTDLLSALGTAEPGDFSVAKDAAGMLGITYILLIIQIILFNSFVFGFIRQYVENGQDGISFESLLHFVFKMFLPLLVIYFVYLVVVIAGSLFFILPGLALMIYMLLAPYVKVYEEKPIFESISRSFKLVYDNWWTAFGLNLAAGIIMYIIYIILSLPVLLFLPDVNPLFGDAVNTSSQFDLWMLVSGLYGVITNFVMIIPLVATSLLYFSIVEKKEARGLESKMDELEKKLDSDE